MQMLGDGPNYTPAPSEPLVDRLLADAVIFAMLDEGLRDAAYIDNAVSSCVASLILSG